MPTTPECPSAEPLRASIRNAGDRIRTHHWMAPQTGIEPLIRIGRRWINVRWGLPIGAAALLCLIALAQSLRDLPGVSAFIRSNPASPSQRRPSTRVSPGGCSCHP